MYSLYHDNRNKCVSLIPHFDDCCNYHIRDGGLHVEGKLFDEVGLVSAIVGDLKMSIRSTDYEGWLVCDGREVSRATYSALYTLIGTTFGVGDGETTFNLPNAQGRVLGSVTSNLATNSLSIRCVGDLVGTETHTLTIDEMPIHNHGVTDPQHNHGITDPGHSHSLPLSSAALVGTGPEDDVTQGSGYGSGTSTTGITINNAYTNISINNTGNSEPHNNMQPTLFIGNTFIYSGVKNSSAYNQPCSNTYVLPPCLNED